MDEDERSKDQEMAALRQAKQGLRSLMQGKLAELPTSLTDREFEAANIAEKLLSLDTYRNAKSVSVYLSMPTGEAVTKPIVTDAIFADKLVYVPFIHQGRAIDKAGESRTERQMDMVSLASTADFKQCEENRDRWGIPSVPQGSIDERARVLNLESGAYSDVATTKMRHAFKDDSRESAENTLDMIVVPGMAFDRDCRRLGHGKGFYDRFLADYRRIRVDGSKAATRMPFLVGLALTEQVMPLGEEIPVSEDDWCLDALILGDGSIIKKPARDGRENLK